MASFSKGDREREEVMGKNDLNYLMSRVPAKKKRSKSGAKEYFCVRGCLMAPLFSAFFFSNKAGFFLELYSAKVLKETCFVRKKS